MKSNKTLGILLLLIYVCVCTAILNDAFIKPYNLQNVLRSSSMFAIIGIGAVMAIVTSGIDLSMGSLIGLVGCTLSMNLHYLMKFPASENFAWFLRLLGWELVGIGALLIAWHLVARKLIAAKTITFPIVFLLSGALCLACGPYVGSLEYHNWLSVAIAVSLAMYISFHLGLIHGLLITKLNLQPFIVTLCGLMCYRGLSRWITSDQTQGFGTAYDDSLRLAAIGKPCTVTFVALCGAILLVLFGVWKAVFVRRDTRTEDRSFGFLYVALGLILILATSSRYWDGWELKQYGDSLVNLFGMEFRFFSLRLPKEAIARPAQLMAYSIYPAIACSVVLVGLQIRFWLKSVSNSRRVAWFAQLFPIVGLVFAVIGLYKMIGWIDGEAVNLASLEETTLWGVSTTKCKIIGVYLLMALFTMCILMIRKIWIPIQGMVGRLLWTTTTFFSVLWLLSKTKMLETVVQTPFFFLLAIGTMAAIFLNRTVSGRYLLAMGNNEDAAKYSGINTDRMKMLAYLLCALCGGVGGILFTLDSNSVEPSGHGSFYELYAIAAAVLGGCSLRGGEGSILGVVIGATIMRVLLNAPDMIGISDQLAMFTIGIVILIGVIVDETARRIAAYRDRMGRSESESAVRLAE